MVGVGVSVGVICSRRKSLISNTLRTTASHPYLPICCSISEAPGRDEHEKDDFLIFLQTQEPCRSHPNHEVCLHLYLCSSGEFSIQVRKIFWSYKGIHSRARTPTTYQKQVLSSCIPCLYDQCIESFPFRFLETHSQTHPGYFDRSHVRSRTLC